jgi:hypothetical protein
VTPSAAQEVITAWTDVENDMQKIEYYGGMDTYIYRCVLDLQVSRVCVHTFAFASYDAGMAYEIVPIMDKFGCFSSNVSGPTLAYRGVGDVPNEPQVLPLVPDISGW